MALLKTMRPIRRRPEAFRYLVYQSSLLGSHNAMLCQICTTLQQLNQTYQFELFCRALIHSLVVVKSSRRQTAAWVSGTKASAVVGEDAQAALTRFFEGLLSFEAEDGGSLA